MFIYKQPSYLDSRNSNLVICDIHIMLFVIIFFGLGLCRANGIENGSTESKAQVVKVGVILNLGSPLGKMAKSYISMAVSDFYAINANYRTRLALSVKDTEEDVVEAASAGTYINSVFHETTS